MLQVICIALAAASAVAVDTDRITEYSMSNLMKTFSNSFDLIDEPERVAGYFDLDRTTVRRHSFEQSEYGVLQSGLFVLNEIIFEVLI